MAAEVLRVLLVGLAGYRLARLVSTDTITDGPRRWVYEKATIWYDEDGDPIPVGAWGWFYKLLECGHCSGVWLTVPLFAAFTEWGWSRWPIAALACVGAQSLLTSFARDK